MGCHIYFNETVTALIAWKFDELNNGNRIKASRIQKIQERINARYYKYCMKMGW